METTDNTTIASYTSHKQAELAIIKLHESGFDVRKISLIEEDFYITSYDAACGKDNASSNKEVLQPILQPIPSRIILLANGSPTDIETIGKVLGIKIKKPNFNAVPNKIVLSGGERSPLQ